MDSMPLTAGERKSREVKSRAVLVKNARILRVCGFVDVPPGKVRGQWELWRHPKFTMPQIAINQHEFESIEDVVCLVHEAGVHGGAYRVRSEFKKLMRIL